MDAFGTIKLLIKKYFVHSLIKKNKNKNICELNKNNKV